MAPKQNYNPKADRIIGGILSDVQGGEKVNSTLALVTPSTLSTASRAWVNISPATGQPGDVSDIVTSTWESSMLIS
jgi:hypothetical protein